MKHKSISRYAVQQTRELLKAFSKALKRAARQPQEPETIHDLRVSIRRLTQSFRTFRELLKRTSVEKLRRRLHKIMDLCASVRNCDVALTLLDQLRISPGESTARLKKSRLEAEGKLRRRLKKEHRKRYSAPPVSARATAGDWNLDQSPETNLSRVLPALAEAFFTAGKAAAGAGVSDRTLHQFRLRAKRFRYTLELFERYYGTEMARAAKLLKELQDRLGEINDCVVTINVLQQDSRAVAALGSLLRQRRSALQTYARRQFTSENLDWWKRWLAQPVSPNS